MSAEWHARLAAGDGAAVVRELAAGTGEHLDTQRLSRIKTPTRLLRGDSSQTVLPTRPDAPPAPSRSPRRSTWPGADTRSSSTHPRLVADSVVAMRQARAMR